MSKIINTTVESMLKEDITRDVFIGSLKDTISAGHTTEDFIKRYGSVATACGLFDEFLDSSIGAKTMKGFTFSSGKPNKKRYLVFTLGNERRYKTFHQNVLNFKKPKTTTAASGINNIEEEEEEETNETSIAGGCSACTAKDVLITSLQADIAVKDSLILSLQSELAKIKTVKGTSKKDKTGKASLRA